jgi:hypothetical protein
MIKEFLVLAAIAQVASLINAEINPIVVDKHA